MTHGRCLRIAATACIIAITLASGLAARAQDPENGPTPGTNDPTNETDPNGTAHDPGNSPTLIRQAPPPTVPSNHPASALGAADSTENATHNSTGLLADIWIETWYVKQANIYRVDPDGSRAGPSPIARMYQNFSIVSYAKNTSVPFHYVVQVDGVTVNEGDSTWKLDWETGEDADTFNITVTITQNGQSKTAVWAHVYGVTTPDTGGLNGAAQKNENLIEMSSTDFMWFVLKLITACAVLMAATFYLIGGIHLERLERMGWSRWGI